MISNELTARKQEKWFTSFEPKHSIGCSVFLESHVAPFGTTEQNDTGLIEVCTHTLNVTMDDIV